MNLTLTQYIDADPGRVTDQLEVAVAHGLDAAGVRVDGGRQILDGHELRVSGTHRLTTLEVVVPWTSADSNGTKLLAANTFAHTVATELRAAA